MAISTTGYFSNAIVGQPQAGADIDIHEVNSTPKFALGFGFTRSDGNKYRYVQLSAATSAGTLVSYDAVAGDITTANACTAPASAVAVSGDNINVGAIGSRYVELTGVLVSANQLGGSYMSIYGGPGVGYSYRVKGNTLSGAIGSGLTRVQLYEPLIVAVTAASDISFTFSPCANLIASDPTTGTGNVLAGVLCADVNTADYFGWVCEEGITLAKVSATITVGAAVSIGGTAGMVANYAPTATCATNTGVVTIAAVNPIIGKAITAGAGGAYGVIRLKAL